MGFTPKKLICLKRRRHSRNGCTNLNFSKGKSILIQNIGAGKVYFRGEDWCRKLLSGL
jgi:hypothetical protein